MGADPTLVKAAFQEAESRAKTLAPDMTPLFKSRMDISKQYLSGIQGIFAELEADEKADKLGRDNQLKGFKSKLENARKHILDQQQPLPMKIHDAIYDRLKELQDEFELVNTYGDEDNPENEKMRAQLDARLQKIINSAVEARGKLGTIAALGGSISSNSSAESMAIADKMYDFENYSDDGIQISMDENDNLVWNINLPGYWSDATSSWDEKQSWTIKDLEDNLIIKDYYTTKDGKTFTTGYEMGKYEASYKTGKDTNKEFNRESEIADIKNNVLHNDDVNMFAAVAALEIDGNKSFRDSLLESPDIAQSAIEHLFMEDIQIGFTFEDMDKKPDGILNEQDAINLTDEEKRLWKDNYNEIVKAITDPRHRAFNFSLSEKMLSEFMVERREQSFKDGRKVRNAAIQAERDKSVTTPKDNVINWEHPSGGRTTVRPSHIKSFQQEMHNIMLENEDAGFGGLGAAIEFRGLNYQYVKDKGFRRVSWDSDSSKWKWEGGSTISKRFHELYGRGPIAPPKGGWITSIRALLKDMNLSTDFIPGGGDIGVEDYKLYRESEEYQENKRSGNWTNLPGSIKQN